MKTELKPKLSTYSITIDYDYWACLDDSHRHKDYDVAEKCIANHGKGERFKRPKEWLIEKHLDVINDRDVAGMTFREIGVKYGVSAKQGGYLYRKSLRIRSKGPWVGA